MCAGGPPKPTIPIRPHARATAPSVGIVAASRAAGPGAASPSPTATTSLAAQEEEQRDEAAGDQSRAAEVRDVEAVHERLCLVRRLRLAPESAQRLLCRVDGERCEDREPECAADLLRRVVEAGCEARVVVRGSRSSR